MPSSLRLAAIFAALCSVSAVRAANTAEPGPYAVGFTSFTALDPTRNAASGGRPVPIAVFYPVDWESIGPGTSPALYARNPFAPSQHFLSIHLEAYGIDAAWQEPPPSAQGPFPALIHSPGARAPWHAQIFVATRLASHGFVVAIVTHYGAAVFPGEPRHHLAQLLVDRPRDMSFALDSLLARNATGGDLLRGLVDPGRVAAGGHSVGGYGAITLASGADRVCDLADEPGVPAPPETCVANAPDPRFGALLLLDASNQFLHFYELSRVEIPSIGIGEDYETLRMLDAATASWQARQHAAFSGHPAYRVDVMNTRHTPSFTNRCEMTLAERDLGFLTPAQVAARWAAFDCATAGVTPYSVAHAIVNRYAVAFLKTALAGEPGYGAMLTPGFALIHEPDAQFFVTEKRTAGPPEGDWPGEFWYFTTQPGNDRARAPMDADVVMPLGLVDVEAAD